MSSYLSIELILLNNSRLVFQFASYILTRNITLWELKHLKHVIH